jgi:hypothetical protein
MNTVIHLKSVLTEWLLGMVLVSFEFSAGFRLRFERLGSDDENKPQVIYLNIKAMSYIGDLDQWNDFVKSLPMEARRSETDEPAFAYRLMLIIGAEVNAVHLASDGTLSIGTNDGESITVVGKDDVWEESWMLAEPEDVAGENARFVACDSKGELSSC